MTPDQRLLSKIFKELLKLNNEKTNKHLKWATEFTGKEQQSSYTDGK